MGSFGDDDNSLPLPNLPVLITNSSQLSSQEISKVHTRWICAHISSSQGDAAGGLSGMKMKSAPPLPSP